MKVQVIEEDGRPEWAVISYTEYERLMEAAESMEEVRDYDAVRQALGSGSEELVPGDVADQFVDGENPVRVWRKHRGPRRPGSCRRMRAYSGSGLADREW